jgi:non-homologous end joining protein Ku
VRIGGCVSLSEVDPLLYLDSYFVQPADAIAEVEYTALYSALRDSKRALIGKISMYRRESLAAVRAGHSGIILHTLFYAHEVRRVDEFRTDLAIMDSDAGKSAARRIRSAVRKLGQGADVENQTDGYRAAIVAMIRQKVDGNHSGFLVTTASPSDGAGPS